MGEIKSAIELAMERTKNLVMGEQEKKEFARKDMEDKLRAAIRRYQEGMIGQDGFLSEYEDIKGEEPEKRGYAVDQIISELEATTNRDRLFDLLEILAKGKSKDLTEEVRDLKEWFRSELNSRDSDIAKRILTRLSGLGISGDAIKPNIPEWEESHDAAREISSLIKSRVGQWKERLLRVSA
jgi:hypothetical protein